MSNCKCCECDCDVDWKGDRFWVWTRRRENEHAPRIKLMFCNSCWDKKPLAGKMNSPLLRQYMNFMKRELADV